MWSTDIEKIELQIKLAGIKVKELVEYIAEEYKDEVLEKIGDKEILEYIKEEVALADILNTVEEDEIAWYLNSEYKVSGWFMIKSENLSQTQRIEEFKSRLSKM